MISNLITFSICVPAYKSRFLNSCIESILNQTYTNFELIILNDQSPEPVEEIVSSFSDSRIRYYSNNVNVGAEKLVVNWNTCLEKSYGEFVIIMVDDDRLEVDYLSEFVNLILKYPNLDVYHCRSKIIDNLDRDVMLTASWPEFENIYENIWHRITEKRSQYISDFVYRTRTLRDRGGFFYMPLAWGSDDISAYLACGSKGIAHINKPIFNYRSHDTSITSTGNVILKLQANMIYSDWLCNFLNSVPFGKEEQIMHNELKANFKQYLRRRNIRALSKSLVGNYIKNAFCLLSNFNKYNLSISDVLMVIGNSIRYKLKRN